jgi:RNase adapter protein RapZ
MTETRGSADELTLVIVTGMSGAGKTIAVNALEDLGFYCVDNLPPPVLEATLDALDAAGERRIAFGIDVRVRNAIEQAEPAIEQLRLRSRAEVMILYLDASDELLSRRFNATRRPHPLTARARGGVRALFEGIAQEREIMAPLRSRASVVVDTSGLTVHQLRDQVMGLFEGQKKGRLLGRLVSFGFKYGTPRDADVVLDARFLPNPHFDESLRPMSGIDQEVRRFVMAHPDAVKFIGISRELAEFCLPRFLLERKAYATIAIGCTGGRHRSVALVEELLETLREGGGLAAGIDLEAVHRDMHRPEHTESRHPLALKSSLPPS